MEIYLHEIVGRVNEDKKYIFVSGNCCHGYRDMPSLKHDN